MSALFERGFFVREPAWHREGVVLQDYPGIDEAMKLAGHDHEIVEVPLYIPVQQTDQPDTLVEQAYKLLTGHKALARKDTGHIVSVMNSSYEVIQNKVPWTLIDQLFEQGAKWDTAGLLKGRFDEAGREVKGQVYWCLSLLDEPTTVKGDDSLTFPYIAATWSHDGSQALRIRAMSVRIVCANTHHAAMYGLGAELDVSIRHIGDVQKRIEAAKTSLSLARKAHTSFMEVANELAGLSVSDEGIETFIQTVIPLPDARLVTDRVRANVEKSRGQLRDIFNSRTIGSGIRNTAYGLVEGGVEYFDHVRRFLSQDSYFTRNVMTCDKSKTALIATAREIAATTAA